MSLWADYDCISCTLNMGGSYSVPSWYRISVPHLYKRRGDYKPTGHIWKNPAHTPADTLAVLFVPPPPHWVAPSCWCTRQRACLNATQTSTPSSASHTIFIFPIPKPHRKQRKICGNHFYSPFGKRKIRRKHNCNTTVLLPESQTGL